MKMNMEILFMKNNERKNWPWVISREMEKKEEEKIDVGGVRKLLANIDTSKAIGPDQIPNQALKLAADEIAPVLQHIFQQSLDSLLLQCVSCVNCNGKQIDCHFCFKISPFLYVLPKIKSNI